MDFAITPLSPNNIKHRLMISARSTPFKELTRKYPRGSFTLPLRLRSISVLGFTPSQKAIKTRHPQVTRTPFLE